MNVKGIIKQIYWRAIQSRFFNRFRTRITHVGSFLVEGKTRGNSNLSILVFADHKNVVLYMSKLAYSEEPQVTNLGTTTYHKIPSIIADRKPDIVFAEFNGVFSDFFSRTFLILPRVNFSLDISPPWETVIARMRRLRRRNIRKIEGLSYVYEVTRDSDKFGFFYENMYVPFVSKTPEDSARLTSRSVAKEWFLNGELTFVKLGDTYLSGILHHPDNGSMHCRLVAYEDGMACQAALYSVFKKAKQEGCTEVNYGETPPFMRDGLFLYKRSWGMKTKAKLDTSYAIKFCNFEKAVQDFLIDNPFIFTDFKSLVGLVLLSSNDVDFNSLYRKYYTPGIHKLVAIYPAIDKKAHDISASEDRAARGLGALDSLIELASEKKFEKRIFDLTK